MKSPEEMAKMLIYGFVKSWQMKTFSSAVGLEIDSDEKRQAVREIAPFLPTDLWQYAQPCRAFIEANYPKLADYLIKHEKEPAKLLAAALQLTRLKCKGLHGNKFNAEDAKEAQKQRKIYRQRAIEAAVRTSVKNSNQRGAWDVCKG